MRAILYPDLVEYSSPTALPSEFYKRELNLEFTKETTNLNESLPEGSLIFCFDIDHWEKRLNNSAPNSLVVVLAGNEYYNIDSYLRLDDYESIRFAFVEMLPNFPLSIPFKELAMAIIESPGVLGQRHFWGTLKSAAKHYRCLDSMRLKTPIKRIPLGYGNRFVSELETMGILQDDHDSLLQNLIPFSSGPRKDFTFFGQKGSWCRRHIVDKFAKVEQFKKDTYGTWGGFVELANGKAEYANSLISSRFVLVPPGNCSSEGWRYMESIVCGAVPIIAETSIQDWTRHSYWPNDITLDTSTYWSLWNQVKDMTDDTLIELQSQLLVYVRKVVEEIVVQLAE